MNSPPLSPQRLARLFLWVKLWLQRLGANLPSLIVSDPHRARRDLGAMARCAGDLVVIRAAQSVRPAVLRPAWRRPVQRAGLLRALKGGRLRRRLRGCDPIARFFAILSVLRNLESLAAQTGRRLVRGLTRLRPLPPVRACEDAGAPRRAAAASVSVDSS